ncbi:MAG: SH3 domain-containing protein [Lachnospiraceae bacterium]|nr:SH3 domain-containing protein [Lachnospiraceae bacterium]
MMKKYWKKGLVLGLSFLLAFETPFHFPAAVSTSYGAERPASVKATTLNVRSGPGTGNSIVAKLSYGAAVTVLGETAGSDGALWYQIRFTGNGGTAATGYASGRYIQFPTQYSSDGNFEAYLNSQGFPESYRPALRELHARYPQWVFTAMDTGLDWNEVIQNESLVGRNLVSSSSISSWKSIAAGAYDWGSSTWPGFDGSTWVAASEDIIRYYMDPRNFLNETYIFQFLLQSYDGAIHTREGLAALVKGTFLEGNAVVSSSYAGAGATENGNGTGGEGAGPGGSGNPGNSGSNGNSGTGGPGTSNGSGTIVVPDSGNSGSSGNNGSQGNAGSGVWVGIAPGQSAGNGGSGTNAGAGTMQGGGNGSGNTGTAPGGSGGVSTGTAPGGSGSGSAGAPQGGNSSTSQENGDVSVGVAPGTNISRAVPGGSSVLTRSLHPTDTVAATIIRVGPGQENGNSDSNSASPGGSGTAGGRTAPYVDILMQAGAESGVSPYVLAAMILQEQGTEGKSASISGASGYYNFYNFEAYASNGMSPVERGLWYASQSGGYQRPWNSIDKSIIGGACQYGQNYVKAGQNTFYLKKFNVQGSNLYKHQYMTNIQGGAGEGAKMAEAYSENMRQTALHFVIPIFRNMPAEACGRPTLDGSPNNKLSGIGVDGFTLVPAFNWDTNLYDVSVNRSVTSVMLRAAALDSTAQISGIGTVNLNGGVTEAKILVTAQNGTVREYTVRITQSENGPLSNGSVGMTGSAGQNGSAGGSYGPGGNDGGSSAGQNNGSGSDSYGPGYGSGPGSTGNNGGADGTGQTSGNSGPGGSNVTIVQ